MAQANVIIVQSQGPNIFIRFLYFIFIGWWLGGIVSGLAWLINLTIIGLPLGLYIINRLPTLMTLRPQEKEWRAEGNKLIQGKAQRPFWFRALYFILIGIWFSGVWLFLAYVCLITLVLSPLAFVMYGRVGAVTTLFRS